MPDKSPEVEMAADGAGRGSISLDQLIAFNDELAALVRAGLPLERSLCELAPDIPGSLGDTVQVLAARLSRGESLPQALTA
ncbi:MAG: type II secretion system F family protein [Planctomycetes bacterium]|nr:type II secretion system F family protein [Planctomycetota bacterium]